MNQEQPRSTYGDLILDEWLDWAGDHDIACCGCLLTHRIKARIRNGKPQLKWSLRAGATANLRRTHPLPVLTEYNQPRQSRRSRKDDVAAKGHK